jgi:hypothetical protein
VKIKIWELAHVPRRASSAVSMWVSAAFQTVRNSPLRAGGLGGGVTGGLEALGVDHWGGLRVDYWGWLGG